MPWLPEPKKASERQANRLKLSKSGKGPTLIKAVELIGSDIKYTNTKPKRKLLVPNEQAVRVLTLVAAADANQGWEILRWLDGRNIYGWLVYKIYAEFCLKDLLWFIGCILTSDASMLEFTQKAKRE